MRKRVAETAVAVPSGVMIAGVLLGLSVLGVELGPLLAAGVSQLTHVAVELRAKGKERLGVLGRSDGVCCRGGQKDGRSCKSCKALLRRRPGPSRGGPGRWGAGGSAGVKRNLFWG